MLAERLITEEKMDDPALDAATYAHVLHDLARVNRATMAYRPTLRFLSRAAARLRRFRLLDVGFGHGDMLRRIAGWAAQPAELHRSLRDKQGRQGKSQNLPHNKRDG